MARRDSPYMRTYEMGGFGGADASGTGGFGDLISGLFSKKKGKQAVAAKQPAPEAAPEAVPEVAPEVAPEQTQGPSELREFAKTVDVSDRESVKKLQTMMRDAGHVDSEGNPIKVDGIFGKKTLSAMRSVQGAPILPGKAQTSFYGPEGEPTAPTGQRAWDPNATVAPGAAGGPQEVERISPKAPSTGSNVPGAIKNWAGDMKGGFQALADADISQNMVDYYGPGVKKAGGMLGRAWEGAKKVGRDYKEGVQGLFGSDARKVAGEAWGDAAKGAGRDILGAYKDHLLPPSFRDIAGGARSYITGGPERQERIKESARDIGESTGAATRRGGVAAVKGAQAVGRGAKTAAEVALEATQDVGAGISGGVGGFYKGVTTDPNQPPLPQPSRPQVGVNPDIYGDVTARQGASPINEFMVPPPESRETQDAMAPGWHAPMARDYIPPPEPGYRGQLSQPFAEEEIADLWDKKQAMLREGPYSADHRDYTGHYRQKADSVRQAQKPFWKFWSRMFDW